MIFVMKTSLIIKVGTNGDCNLVGSGSPIPDRPWPSCRWNRNMDKHSTVFFTWYASKQVQLRVGIHTGPNGEHCSEHFLQNAIRLSCDTYTVLEMLGHGLLYSQWFGGCVPPAFVRYLLKNAVRRQHIGWKDEKTSTTSEDLALSANQQVIHGSPLRACKYLNREKI